MKIILTIAMLIVLASTSVVADGIVNPGTQFVGNMHEGISNAGGGTPTPPPVSCDMDAGQLDFRTACGTLRYMVIFR
jgi:hypothetical protein